MKNYENYTVTEFVEDEKFLKWVKYANLYPELDAFWREWIVQYSYKVTEVEEARRLILAVQDEGQLLAILKIENQVWERLRHSMLDEERKKATQRNGDLAVAATTTLLLIVVGYFTYSSWITPPQAVGDNFLKEINNASVPKAIVLADGSSITLLPKSELQYPTEFDNNQREVILSGEAFFDIARESNRPFIVYTDAVVTKVLGTSFTIRAVSAEENVSVKVKTGKVSVSTISLPKDKGSSEVVLLAPNQQVTYSRIDEKMRRSLVDNPEILHSVHRWNFTFKDTPVNEMFNQLENAYGIDIIYDEESFSNCSINAALDDMHLYDKMRLICKTLEAQYEIVDSHIVVTGKGCND